MNSFDPQEVERLVDTYSDTVLRLSYSYLRSVQDAEDICQTVFLKLLTAGTVFASPAHEKAFIIRATINACKNELKAVRHRLLPLDEAAAGTAPEPGRLFLARRSGSLLDMDAVDYITVCGVDIPLR